MICPQTNQECNMLPTCELKETEGSTSCVEWVKHQRMIGRKLQGMTEDIAFKDKSVSQSRLERKIKQ